MPYLVWREGPDGRFGEGEYDKFADRGRCLDLSLLYVAPRFETGDARYAWLNKVQAVGKGSLDAQANVVSYEWFEMR